MYEVRSSKYSHLISFFSTGHNFIALKGFICLFSFAFIPNEKEYP